MCQSWVSTTFWKDLAILLISGMISSPLATARLPPSRKQFCTSTTTSAVSGPGLILPCASARPISDANDRPPAAASNERRDTSCMAKLLRHDCCCPQLRPHPGSPEALSSCRI